MTRLLIAGLLLLAACAPMQPPTRFTCRPAYNYADEALAECLEGLPRGAGLVELDLTPFHWMF